MGHDVAGVMWGCRAGMQDRGWDARTQRAGHRVQHGGSGQDIGTRVND